jgi:eukaryotic-like serine/threonine-protein kinase
MLDELHNYTLIKELGNQKKRKFGHVYLALRSSDNLLVTIKQISKKEGNATKRLKTELAFHFSESFLPQIIESIENEEFYFLILKHKQGITLNEYWNLNKSKFQTLKFITLGLKPIFDSLKIKGIIHADIRPENIIIDTVNNQFHLIDFGLAFYQNELPDTTTLFPLGYAAPELILNQLHLANHTTDLFALGITYWKLFTNQLPLSHPNPSIMTNLQITHPLPEHAEIPTKIYEILNKTCFKHPFKKPPNQYTLIELNQFLISAQEERYQTIDEILKDLNKIKVKNFLGFEYLR